MARNPQRQGMEASGARAHKLLASRLDCRMSLRRFGREVFGVRDPRIVLARIAEAMADTLHAAGSDPRIPAALLAQLRPVWEIGIRHAQ